MPHRLAEPRQELDLGVVVRVQIDEAGHHPLATHIDALGLGVIHRAVCGDAQNAVALDEHIARQALTAESVEESSVCEQRSLCVHTGIMRPSIEKTEVHTVTMHPDWLNPNEGTGSIAP